ncbi:MAG: hypothetical protein ABFD20_01250 [Anaerolineales bacterium]
MTLVDIVEDQSLNSVQKRERIAKMLTAGDLTVKAIDSISSITDKGYGLILEAMEQVSRDDPTLAEHDWMGFAGRFIESGNNTLKRESSRVVGNIAETFSDEVEDVIPKLLANTTNEGTVVRWGSAYALARIIALPRYANSDLFEAVSAACAAEQNSGVRNQYLAGLKRAAKLRM